MHILVHMYFFANVVQEYALIIFTFRIYFYIIRILYNKTSVSCIVVLGKINNIVIIYVRDAHQLFSDYH